LRLPSGFGGKTYDSCAIPRVTDWRRVIATVATANGGGRPRTALRRHRTNRRQLSVLKQAGAGARGGKDRRGIPVDIYRCCMDIRFRRRANSTGLAARQRAEQSSQTRVFPRRPGWIRRRSQVGNGNSGRKAACPAIGRDKFGYPVRHSHH